MKKLVKMTAVFLGWSSCVAQSGKCLQSQQGDDAVTPEVGQNQTPELPRSGLTSLQDLDHIYYL